MRLKLFSLRSSQAFGTRTSDHRNLCAYALAILSLAVAGFANAQNTSRSTLSYIRSLRCPSFIADTRTGTYIGNSGNRPRYYCFNSAANAKSAGYLAPASAERINLTGWYRLHLSRSVSNTCDSNPTRSGPVLFFQLKDHRDGIFGQFCPTFGTYTGYKEDSGIVISGEQEADEDPSGSICADGQIRIQRFVKLTRSKTGSTGMTAEYKEIISCRSSSSGASVCAREYSGSATKETHRIWPSVPSNILDLSAGCSQALLTCAGCHPGIDFGGLHP